jgi:hypothetical protein
MEEISVDSCKLLLDCSICMENKTIDKISFLPCIHFLCSACHEKLKKNECPFCRNRIRDESEYDSYDERENEYNDVNFEMLVLEEDRRSKRKKNRSNKRNEKRIMKLMKNNNEIIISIRRNEYEILSTVD